jgi:hypothetical protein
MFDAHTRTHTHTPHTHKPHTHTNRTHIHTHPQTTYTHTNTPTSHTHQTYPRARAWSVPDGSIISASRNVKWTPLIFSFLTHHSISQRLFTKANCLRTRTLAAQISFNTCRLEHEERVSFTKIDRGLSIFLVSTVKTHFVNFLPSTSRSPKFFLPLMSTIKFHTNYLLSKTDLNASPLPHAVIGASELQTLVSAEI